MPLSQIYATESITTEMPSSMQGKSTLLHRGSPDLKGGKYLKKKKKKVSEFRNNSQKLSDRLKESDLKSNLQWQELNCIVMTAKTVR